MASNTNNTSSAGLFGQSLEGDLLFDQISGPRLFMPIPVSTSVEATSQPGVELLTPADDAPLTFQIIDELSKKLGRDWKRFARGTEVFTDQHIESIDADEQRVYDKCYKMIKTWEEMSAAKVTIAMAKMITVSLGRNDLLHDVFNCVNSPPPVHQHAQSSYQQSSNLLPADINSSFANSNQNTQQQFFQQQKNCMASQDLVAPPSATSPSRPHTASSHFLPTQMQQYPQQQQQQQQLKQSYQLHQQQVRSQQPQQYQQFHHQQGQHQPQQFQQQQQQPPQQSQLYQPQQKVPLQSAHTVPYNANVPPLVAQSMPEMTPPPAMFTPNVALYTPQQQTCPQRPTQIVPPISKQVHTAPDELDSGAHPKVSPISSQTDFSLPQEQVDPNVPTEYNISPLAGKTGSEFHPPTPLPVQTLSPHWFYFKDSKKWMPFSYFDSNNLETLFINPSSKKSISTDGGRFDVDLETMRKTAVYWSEAPCEVRRCTWFYKGGTESKLVPYDTIVAERLEKNYVSMMKNGVFNIRVDISPGKFIIFHNPNVLVQYTSKSPEHMGWTGEDSTVRPKVVRRGISEIQEEMERGETDQIDHLVFVVHGIGPVADLRMRSIVECVDDFRKISFNQVTSHGFRCNGTLGNRVEFLPIQWHSCLRDDRHGVDRQLKALSLPSISKLRNFTNETLTDILFFTSPIYCQTICDTVVGEMNRLYKLFKSRNPSYTGSVSVVGHSLGSCILFDILAHQVDKNTETEIYEDVGEVIDSSNTSLQSTPQSSVEFYPRSPIPQGNTPLPSIDVLCAKLNLSNLLDMFKEEQIDTETIMMCSEGDLRDLEIPFGPRKKILAYIREQSTEKVAFQSPNHQRSSSQTSHSSTRGTQTPVPLDSSTSSQNVQYLYKKANTGIGQPLVKYSKLEFETSCLFCLGSPIGLFLTCRGIHSIGTDFKLPTCPGFMNIFHPYDPVVYRLEPLINENIDIPPSLIPHHKGRKRFHLEIKENLSRAGAHLKHSILDAVNRTWSSINDFAKAHRTTAAGEEVDVDQVSQMVTGRIEDVDSTHSDSNLDSLEDPEVATKVKLLDFGMLNNGGRVDYVLQENPFELINEYIFALSSHTCYWSSDDTALVIVDKIYSIL